MHSSLCFLTSLAVASANVGSHVSFNGMTHAVNHLAGGDRLAAAAHATALQTQGFQGGFQGFQGQAAPGFQGPTTAGFQGGFQGFQGPAAPGFQGQFQGFQGPAAAPAAPAFQGAQPGAFQAAPGFQQQTFQSAAAFQGAAPAFNQAAPGGFVNFQG